ncbi:MAG: UDP-glucose 4-epimerase GalE [Proteobacteria bacterium]|nr:UDP-glucose 4-epimerase GalE [Pseudomonadota bacterium]
MKVLVCGGAGYIGSHMVKMLDQEGHDVTVFDNLSTGHKEAVKWGRFAIGDLTEKGSLDSLFEKGHFDAVMHFSAKSLVGESMTDPAGYYRNNVLGTINLLNAMRDHDVKTFIFSSSAATYGNPIKPFIDETHPLNPINPYGKTKLMVEKILEDYEKAYHISSVSLRYFNAAGADKDGDIGESHDPETHLIPNIIKSVVGDRVPLKVFGNDYATKDGTCVRDYIHVTDLAKAHLLSLDYMNANKGAHVFNLGNGKGFSILDVIHAAENVINGKIDFEYQKRRAGDPPTLVADSTFAKMELGWKIEYDNMTDIIKTAFAWHKNQTY